MKKIWNVFQEHDFFRVLKVPALFAVLNRWEIRAGNFKSRKKHVLESFSNIFSPLVRLINSYSSEMISQKFPRNFRMTKSIKKWLWWASNNVSYRCEVIDWEWCSERWDSNSEFFGSRRKSRSKKWFDDRMKWGSAIHFRYERSEYRKFSYLNRIFHYITRNLLLHTCNLFCNTP